MSPLATSAPVDQEPRLSHYLAAVDDLLPAVLVPQPYRSRIVAAARRFPVARMAGFEAHLNRGRVDFAVRLAAGEVGASAWCDHASRQPHLSWSCVERGLAERRVRDMWLELDVEADAVSPPSIFCGLLEPAIERRGQRLPPHVASLLSGFGARPDALATLARLHRLLGPGAQMFQVGLMLARPERGLRVLLRGLEPLAIAALLVDMGWSGDGAEIGDLAQVWGRRVDEVFVSLDLGAEVGPRLGLELMFRDQSAVGFDPRWARLLGAMHSAQLCSAAERDALVDWPGWTTEASAAERWPANLRHAAAQRFLPKRPALARMINHAKLVIAPDRSISAKVYFGFQTTWIDEGPHR